ncbi:hypothetical protein [Candidatus Palauibacter sp.]|uniref:hypothetical protein n=1 Tax=Candidatus Palauibacter sp. TaxID=3101350 RepID=UPI003CC5480F
MKGAAALRVQSPRATGSSAWGGLVMNSMEHALESGAMTRTAASAERRPADMALSLPADAIPLL